MSRRSIFYIAIATGALCLTFVLGYFYKNYPDKDLFVRKVKENLSKEIKYVQEQANDFKQIFDKESSVSFQKLFQEYRYPLYVYRNGQLLYWSANDLNIPYSKLENYYREKSIQLNDSIFYVTKNVDYIEGEEYEIIIVVPLQFAAGQESRFEHFRLNPQIFPDQQVNLSLDREEGNVVASVYGTYLFSITYPDNFMYEGNKKWVVVFFGCTFLLFFFLFIHENVRWLLARNRGGWAFILLVTSLVGVRGVMLYLNLPNMLVQTSLFTPEVYASSYLNQSLGDLFLNILSLTIIISFILANLNKLVRFRNLLQLRKHLKHFVSVWTVILTYFAASFIYLTLKNIYLNSEINLDITTEFRFGLMKVLAILVFFLTVTIYFIICHLSSKLILKLSPTLSGITLTFVAGSLSFYLFSLLIDMDNILVFNVNALYFAIVTYFNFPLSLKKAENKTFVYFFICSIACAVLGAYAIYNFHQVRNKEYKNKYANQLLMEDDPVGEYHLGRLVEELETEDALYSLLVQKGGADLVRQYIKRNHVSRYFDKYDQQIYFFDTLARSTEPGSVYTRINDFNLNKSNRTGHPQIYFNNKLATRTSHYYCMVTIYDKQERKKGIMLLSFRLKKNQPSSLYPPMFTGEELKEFDRYKDFSYAIYMEDRLMYSAGDYNYDNRFLNLFRHKKGFLKSEVETEQHIHYRVPGDNDKNIVISSPKYPLKNVFSNFSFLFLMLVFLTVGVIFLISYATRERRENINFSTRIQLYLNFAFFLPLIIVSVVTVSILSTGNQTETRSYYLEKAQSIGSNLAEQLLNFSNDSISSEILNDEITRLARLTHSDVNLYNKNGRLLVASPPGYGFKENIVADLLNPEAYASIIEKNQARLMLSETLGSLDFNSAYVGVKSPETGEVLGIVSIPFFSSRYRFNQQVVAVISTIMQVFTTMFIVLLVLSWFSVKSLTRSLALVTQKIRKVSLGGKNEPIEYHVHDEFGMLIGEYNRMLVKLEESRAALARNEKESAWREMAKQVAHEIKNPLTPMKLTLQQLQKVMGQSANGDERARKSLKVLLDQVEILNDITTSFSSFAQMPLPREKRFNITTLLRESVSLHKDSNHASISTDLPDKDYYIIGDPGLMRRVFTNLILNGIQAVEEGNIPRIHVHVTPFSPNRILIEFRDNGKGIPESIQNKVFALNFSTKATGSGIGLAVAKRGIEHLGGNIWFETCENVGTSFFIEMPLST